MGINNKTMTASPSGNNEGMKCVENTRCSPNRLRILKKINASKPAKKGMNSAIKTFEFDLIFSLKLRVSSLSLSFDSRNFCITACLVFPIVLNGS